MDRVSNALTAIKDAGASGASSVGGFFSTTADSGVTAFKGTSLGESFFKNIGAILVVVMILLGGIIYIDLASSGGGAGAGAADEAVVEKKIYIEPNKGINTETGGGGGGGGGGNARVLPTDVPWTVPAISMRNELKEAFGTAYTETELEKIHTKCSDSFCVMHQKSPEELERACNSITTRQMCGTKCCCGWTKYTGFEGDNDPLVTMNTAEANVTDPSGRSDGAKIPGKCVAGNSKRPFDMKDANNNERDIAYYYYLGECVGGRGCMKEGAIQR
jgi:hypothetical protein